MRDYPAPDSVQASLFPEPVRRQPEPERRTRPGIGVASCKCDRPVGEFFCGTCGRLILQAESDR